MSLRPTPQLERRPSDPEAKPQRCRRGLGAGDLWAGKCAALNLPSSPQALTPSPPYLSPTPAPLLLHLLLRPRGLRSCTTVCPTGRYDVGSAGTPEALRKQLLALQKQPAAMRALRDAMLLEGKVTQSE